MRYPRQPLYEDKNIALAVAKETNGYASKCGLFWIVKHKTAKSAEFIANLKKSAAVGGFTDAQKIASAEYHDEQSRQIWEERYAVWKKKQRRRNPMLVSKKGGRLDTVWKYMKSEIFRMKKEGEVDPDFPNRFC